MKYLEIKLLSVNATIPKRANPTDSGLDFMYKKRFIYLQTQLKWLKLI